MSEDRKFRNAAFLNRFCDSAHVEQIVDQSLMKQFLLTGKTRLMLGTSNGEYHSFRSLIFQTLYDGDVAFNNWFTRRGDLLEHCTLPTKFFLEADDE